MIRRSMAVFCVTTLLLPGWLLGQEEEKEVKPKRTPSTWVKKQATPVDRPVEGLRRALVISVDGCRPDLLLRADTPNIKGLMERGSFTMWARTTAQSTTLPSHVSMLTGVVPNRHTIFWNGELPLHTAVYPRVPTLFEAAKRYGYTTAAVAGKAKFDVFDRPGVLDDVYITDKTAKDDLDVAREAVRIVRASRPEVMFVHFPGVDSAGHSKGWSSPEQMKALHKADAAVGMVLGALDEAGVLDSTLVILSADHGGQGRGHGPEDFRSRHIPWIAAGPGIRRGYDLTINAKLNVNTEDTFATACWMLGIPPTASDLDGAPVKAILEPKKEDELLKPAGKTVLTW